MAKSPEDDMILDIRAWPAYIGASLIGCALFIMIALFVSHVGANGAAQDQPICRAVNVTDYPENARVAEWVGYPEKWAGMPAHFNDDAPIFLYLDETIEAGYVLHFDPIKQELWVFPHWSFVSRGEMGGTHDLCAVIVYALKDHG